MARRLYRVVGVALLLGGVFSNPAQAATNDVGAKLDYLGSPFAKGPYARNCWDMQVFEGKIFLGHGNSSNYNPPEPNAGPIPVVVLDPVTGVFSFETSLGDEQLDRFRIIDGQIVTTSHDPRSHPEAVSFYYRTNAAWTLVAQTALPFYHTYDIAKFNGRLFLTGGPHQNISSVLSSTNNLITCQQYPATVTNGTRLSTLFEFNSRLYAVGYIYPRRIITVDGITYPNMGVGEYDGTNWAMRIDMGIEDLLPGASNLFAIADNHQYTYDTAKIQWTGIYSNQLLYVAGMDWNDHQMYSIGLYAARSLRKGAVDIRPINLGTNTLAWDLLIRSNAVYALASERMRTPTNRYIVKVFTSSDLDHWREMFRFTTNAFARSFEEINGDFYFGLGSDVGTNSQWYGDRSYCDAPLPDSGKIYRLRWQNYAAMTWTAGNGDFGTATNWTPEDAPTAESWCLFTNPAAVRVTLAQDQAVDSLDVQAGTVTLDLGGRTLGLGGKQGLRVGLQAGVTGKLTVVNGTLSSSNLLVRTGQLDVTNARVQGARMLWVGETNAAVGALNLWAGADVQAGTVTVAAAKGTGTLKMSGGLLACDLLKMGEESDARLTLMGGTLQATRFLLGFTNATRTAQVLFSGGSLGTPSAEVRLAAFTVGDGSGASATWQVGAGGGTSTLWGNLFVKSDGRLEWLGTGVLDVQGSVTNLGRLAGNGKLQVAGDYVQTAGTNALFGGTLVFRATNRVHRLAAGAADQGARLAGFANNGGFSKLEINGTIAVEQPVYAWCLSGAGTLQLKPGGRLYYMDDAGWAGTVALEGGELIRVAVALSSVERQPDGSIRLAWETGPGLASVLEWTDNLRTSPFALAGTTRATNDADFWTDLGGADRPPPPAGTNRFYRLSVSP